MSDAAPERTEERENVRIIVEREDHVSVLRWVLVGFGVAAAAVVAIQAPEIRRYLKMRRM